MRVFGFEVRLRKVGKIVAIGLPIVAAAFILTGALHGFTHCLRGEPEIWINPYTDPRHRPSTNVHEQAHVDQNCRYGCGRAFLMNLQPAAALRLEAEAHCREVAYDVARRRHYEYAFDDKLESLSAPLYRIRFLWHGRERIRKEFTSACEKMIHPDLRRSMVKPGG